MGPVQIRFRCHLISAPSILGRINAFAEKWSSRNQLWAFTRAGATARWIQKYRQALKCLRKFRVSVWFQSDINLQVEVHKLVAQQGNGREFPENKDKIKPSLESKGARSQGSSSPGPNSIPTPVANSGGTSGGPSLWGHGIEITHAGGNVTKNHVSNVTNNRDLGNTYTNSIVSVNNITITIPRYKRRRPRRR